MRFSIAWLRPFSASIRSKLDHYSQFHPSSLSIQQFVDFAKNGTSESSYVFLKKELLVRLANIMQEIALLPEPLVETPSVKIVREWYQKSFMEILQYEKLSSENKICEKFTNDLKIILKRHKPVVETMAEGVMELKGLHGDQFIIEKNIQYFLDRFYINRIGIRMLINQHVILFGNGVPEHPEFIGAIHPSCEIAQVVLDAYENARFLCERYYLAAPELEIEMKNASKSNHGLETSDKILTVYVPSHLYHMAFELMKNAMRAVVEYNSSQDTLPKLHLTIVKGKEDLSIKLSDRGGGIARSSMGQLFNYFYTTAPQVTSIGDQAPLAGYGYGLPLSRLYARYFQGDLALHSMEGLGTDAYIYLKALPIDANELLPVYSTASRRIYQAQLHASDWSRGSSKVLQQNITNNNNNNNMAATTTGENKKILNADETNKK